MFSLSLLTKSIRLYFKKIIRTCHLLCKIPNANTAPARHKLQREYFYRPQRSWAKVMFLQASVILSTGGRCLPQWMLGYHPQGADTPPGADTPGRRHPQEQTPPEQTPPEGDSSIRSKSGRYASYWNAFLFV